MTPRPSTPRPSTPWLSVVMPVYQGAATLPAALASLPDAASPEGAGIELVAVVQKSEDGGRELLEAAAARLDLRILEAPECRNWVETTNRGLRAARAETVTMLHQDDLWRPGRAPALRALIARHPGARLWLHAAGYVDAAGRPRGRLGPPFGRRERLLPGPKALEHLLVQNTVALPAAAFRRADALAGGGLDAGLWYTADWELWLRLAGLGPVAWLPETLAAYRLHAGAQTIAGSRDAEAFRAQLAAPVERHIAALPEARRARVRRHTERSNALNAALAQALHGDRRALPGAAARAVALGPFGLRALLRDTQLLARVAARLALLREKSSA